MTSPSPRTSPALPVLLVDDDAGFRGVYRELLAEEGYEVTVAADEPSARRAFAAERPRVVILDLMLPPRGTPDAGVALLDEMLREAPGTKVIIASGAGEASFALSLVRRGAHDFLAKPVDPDVLLAVVARAAVRLRLEDRVAELEAEVVTRDPGRAGGLLGEAPAFTAARVLAERAARTEVPVLIAGESGTGKELFARFVHAESPRARGPFVAVNCGALAPALLESTLFGHKRGAFTGATSDARGLFVEASGGTLFLDEIGDLELSLQVKLLRALEAGEILPVGASKPVQVDVRIVSATHRPLAAMIREKSFRDDLYWRIRGIEITLPRLADRAGDLALLAQHFLNQARAMVPFAGHPRLSAEALRSLEGYAFPGNLRELRHMMQHALVMAAGREEILEADLPPLARGAPEALAGHAQEEGTLDEKIARLEKREIEAALAKDGQNRSHAAARLGLSRQGLLNKMARHGLK
ncbi:MAG: sigma-54-dependent Fis family transcriptional regulator [Labilithrix sp.]|nr:sigma-54-dependent Fis family transcriptional regulator [Labilithrix sp.]